MDCQTFNRRIFEEHGRAQLQTVLVVESIAEPGQRDRVEAELAEFGIDLSSLNSTGREFCRLCLDWTERRPRIAGALGAALTKRCFDLGWIEQIKHGGTVIVTPPGQRGFLETFGIRVPEEKQRPHPRLGGSHARGKDPHPAGRHRDAP